MATIPIVPGPFNFLASLGQGLEQYAAGKENRRRYEDEEGRAGRLESFGKLKFIFEGIKSGDINASVVKSPLFERLVNESGIGEGLSQENIITPEPISPLRTARTAAINRRIPELSQAGQGIFASTGQLPTEAQETREAVDTAVGGLAQRAIGAGLSPEQESALTKIPTFGTATALDQGTQDPVMSAVAYRVVSDLFAKTGRLPTPQEAFQYGSTQDIRARAYGPQLNEPFYGNAVEMLRQEQEKLRIAEVGAQARAASALDVVRQNINPQMQIIQDRIDGRSQQARALMEQVSVMGKLGEPTPYDQQIFNQIEELNRANAVDEQNMEGLRRPAGQIISGRVGAQGGSPEDAISRQRLAWDRAAKAIRDNPTKYGLPANPTDAAIATILRSPRP